ncbi:MAG: ABC transporter substrate-binding protein [Candidatus Promineifilaceae bacterium]
MKKKYIWMFVSLLIIFSLALVACGGDETAETEPTEETPAEPAEETAAEEPTAPEEEVMAEETSITIIIPEDPAAFSSYVADTGYSQLLMELVMVGLTDIDPEGNIFTELAAELPTIENGGVDFNEDEWTMDVTWKLRDDIFWADGEPVTADDVIFSWETATDPEMGTWVEGVDYTDSLEKVDDYTFIVHYNTVYPNYLVQFGGEDFGVWAEHYCDASQGFMAWDCNRNPLSSGPYILDEWETGDHLKFVKNPNYYEEGKPHIDTIYVQIVPENTVAQQLMVGGDADLQIWPTEAVAEMYKGVDNVEVSFAPNERWVMRLIPNLAARGEIDSATYPHPVLSDVNVRRALRMAIDVDTITEDIFLGYSTPVWTEFFRPPYICDIPKPAYDPTAAAALLEEAGWTDEDGDGIRECHGCTTGAEEGYPLSFEFIIYAEYGEELELAQQLIAEMWNAIGVDTQLAIVEGTTLWSGYEDGGIEQSGDYDVDMWDDGYPGIDPTDNQMWYFYHTDAGEPDFGWNVGRWSNEEFDTLLDEAYTLDEEYRAEVFCELAQILEDELPEILLFSAFDASAHSSRLQGVEATVNDTHTWNVADWTVTE